jgi:hypothetical protein
VSSRIKSFFVSDESYTGGLLLAGGLLAVLAQLLIKSATSAI